MDSVNDIVIKIACLYVKGSKMTETNVHSDNKNTRKITILDYLVDNYRHRPNNTAIIEEDESITYKELYKNSILLGESISEILEGKRRVPIVLFMDKSIIHIIGMYGTLFSGNFYVPIDIKTPLDRFESILNTLVNGVIITSKKYESTLIKTGFQGKYYIYEDIIDEVNIDFEEAEVKMMSSKKNIIDTDIMYIIFTSGSTGVPKGVAISHRSLIDYVESFLDEIGMDENDICGNQAPFYADMSDRELFMTMGVGAAICIIPQKMFTFPKKLLSYMEEKKVTFCAWVPTAYRIVMQFDGLEKVRPASLNRILFSGESMPIPVFNYWKKYYPEAKFIQSYGPTEITGSCTYFYADGEYSGDETIPIGKPFGNTGIAIIDDNGIIVDNKNTEKVGEICVYGSCLALGYYNNSEKTGEAFVDLPRELGYGQKMYKTGDLARWNAEGNIVFVSRKDYQIKHMGKRVELGEIEAAISSIGEISACCCVHNREKDAIVLFYVGNIDAAGIEERIGNKLPPYMKPANYERMEQLPQLPNGKLNRKELDIRVNEG